MVKRTIPITIEVPIRVAEFLEDHGHEFIVVLSEIALKSRNRIRQIEYEDRTAVAKSEALSDFVQIGRKEFRKYRSIARRNQPDYSLNAALDEDVFKQLYGQSSIKNDRRVFAIIKFRRSLKERLKTRRDREILRLFGLGYSNAVIAQRYSLSQRYIQNIISNYRREKRKLRPTTNAVADRLGGNK